MNAMTASAPPRVPSPPAPPHDPTSLLLDGHAGWRAVRCDAVVEALHTHALTLAPSPDSLRGFDEASGSLGGLRPPQQMAYTRDALYLLDPASQTLKRFDPCACAFATVPCLGGHGGGARQLRNPGGIAICGDTLFICDSGRDGCTQTGTDPRRQALRERIRRENHRVSLFTLDGFALRGYLHPPRDRYPRWRPHAIACDTRGCAWVTDLANGRIHRFAPDGRWLGSWDGFLRPRQIGVDRCGRIYVIDTDAASGRARLQVFAHDGAALEPPHSVEAAAPRFAPLPFAVLPDGVVDLRACCIGPAGASGFFDAHGQPLPTVPAPRPPALIGTGTYLSMALDSRIARCQWHRVMLHGRLPPGCSVEVATFCADEIHTPQQLDELARWSALNATPPDADDARPWCWDGLIRSLPGRYLWLRLTLNGTGATAPVLDAVQVEFPRLSSLRHLPAVYAAEPVSADFTARLLSLYDTVLRGIERELDTQASWFDPLSTPAVRVGSASVDFLGWLGSWIGVALERSWSEARRRRFLKQAGALFARRGTVEGVREMLLLLLDWRPPRLECPGRAARSRCAIAPANCAPPAPPPAYAPPPLVLEHFRLRRWLLLGVGRLGAQAVLWGQRIVDRSQLGTSARTGETRLVGTPDPVRDPLLVHANRCTVFVPCRYRGEASRRSLRNLLRSEVPAGVEFDIDYVEPRFRIGVQSMIGFDAVVGRLPQGVALAGTPLGRASVLTSGARTDNSRIGHDSRIGTHTPLI
jgi:phage tail-like protein